MLEEGTTFGRYTIERLTGVVGPIEIYVAVLPAGRVRVEVYDLLSAYDFEGAMTSAQVSIELPSEAVVRALEFGRLDDGRVYITRDLLAGSLLSARVPCDPQRARVLVRDLAICVQAAHQRGFAIGDLRAERVFVEDSDRVRLWDLRFARKTKELSREAHADLDRCVAILYQLVTGVQTFANLDPDAAPAFTSLFRRAFESTPASPAFAYAEELIAALSNEEGIAPVQLPVARLLPKKR